ncbi:MAG: thioredoxin family protein [Brachymonas sp.]
MPANAQNRPQKALLPFPADMSQAAQQASRAGQPLVVMVSLPGCPWCELLRRNYLLPLAAEGLPAYEFMVNDRSNRLRDFQGQRVSPAALSAALKVSTTPTVLFFNQEGQEFAPRIEGVASADFIGAVIDERLTTARERLKLAR